MLVHPVADPLGNLHNPLTIPLGLTRIDVPGAVRVECHELAISPPLVAPRVVGDEPVVVEMFGMLLDLL